MEKGRVSYDLCDNGTYTITNADFDDIGYLEKRRVGAWMTWCLFLFEDCYITAGCMDEIREKIKELNVTSNKTSDAPHAKDGGKE